MYLFRSQTRHYNVYNSRTEFITHKDFGYQIEDDEVNAKFFVVNNGLRIFLGPDFEHGIEIKEKDGIWVSENFTCEVGG